MSDSPFGIRQHRCKKGEYELLGTPCEDNVAFDAEAGLFAVSDGASQRSFSDVWSQVLVERFVRDDPLTSDDEFEVERWVIRAAESFAERSPALDDLPAQTRTKARMGAAATFLGVQFVPVDPSTADDALAAVCRVVAIGDCCLFQIRDERLIDSFPWGSAKDFDSNPICFSTKDFDPQQSPVMIESFDICKGDVLVFATDAVAQWLLDDESEDVRRVKAQQILAKHDDESWHGLIKGLRAAKQIVDDDSTALVVQVRQVIHNLPALEERRDTVERFRAEELKDAMESRDEVQLALAYGSGEFLLSGKHGKSLRKQQNQEIIQKCRATAKAMRLVLDALRRSIERGESDHAELRSLWEQHEDLLWSARCAKDIRSTLRGFDVINIEAELARRQGALSKVMEDSDKYEKEEQYREKLKKIWILFQEVGGREDLAEDLAEELDRLQIASVEEAAQPDATPAEGTESSGSEKTETTDGEQAADDQTEGDPIDEASREPASVECDQAATSSPAPNASSSDRPPVSESERWPPANEPADAELNAIAKVHVAGNRQNSGSDDLLPTVDVGAGAQHNVEDAVRECPPIDTGSSTPADVVVEGLPADPGASAGDDVKKKGGGTG